jgi:hypothetical protein
MLLFLCLQGTRIGGGEDDFYLSHERQRPKKKHKDDNFMLSSSCLRRVRIREGGKDDNIHRLLLFFVFHKSDESKGKKT